MKFELHNIKLLLAFCVCLPLTQHAFSQELDDLKLEANVKRACVIEVPTTIELLNISSTDLVNQEPGTTVGIAEKFDVSVDCGADVSPSNVVMLTLEPHVVDGNCLGMDENPKVIQLCLQHRDQELLFVEGEKYYVPVFNDYHVPVLKEQDSAVKLTFASILKTGQQKYPEVTEGEYNIFLNINLDFR